MKKIIRITTVPNSLGGLLKGQLKFMGNYYEIIGISSASNNLLDKVALQEDIRVIPVNMTRKITPFKDIVAVYKLYKIFKREKPFIVHSHTPKAGTLGMLAAFLAHVPNRLHTIAGLPLLVASGKKRILLNLVEKLTYSWATKVYPNSYGLEKIVLEHKFTKKSKLNVIGNGSSNGINTIHFDYNLYTTQSKQKLKSSIGITEKDYIFMFVGRLVKDKGINELVAAFKKINEENPNTKLLLVGTYEKDLDPLDPDTDLIISKNPSIIVTGWQTDVRPYFSIANVLTFPSYREGFPNVVMQAGAMGLPSIVTNINGCNEIIKEGVNGTIIPVKDTNSLALKMKLFSQYKFKTNKEVIRKNIVDSYDNEYIWKELLKEYKSLEN